MRRLSQRPFKQHRCRLAAVTTVTGGGPHGERHGRVNRRQARGRWSVTQRRASHRVRWNAAEALQKRRLRPVAIACGTAGRAEGVPRVRRALPGVQVTGLAKQPADDIRERKLEAFIALFQVRDFDDAAARHCGDIRADLERRSVSIGPLDMLIAVHARSLGAVLVTGHVAEFSCVRGLEVVRVSARRRREDQSRSGSWCRREGSSSSRPQP